MAIWNSEAYDGRYLQLYISETIDTINNTSKLDWKLSSIGGSSAYYTIAETTVTINGTQVYHKAQTAWDSKVFPAAKGSVSGSITVPHNAEGSKTIVVGFSTRVYNFQPLECGGDMLLTNIDRAAPMINISTSSITAYGVTVKATASATCDIWEYSTNNGSSWAQFSTVTGTTASKTITGLSPNTSYTVKVRARKKSNQVYGYSSTAQIKTLGGSILNSVEILLIDEENPVITSNWTVYDASYRHILTIKKGDEAIISFNNLSCSAGTNNKVITLTAAQRNIILDYMKNTAQFTADFQLRTYTDSTGAVQVGNASSKTAAIQTTSANSAPSFSNSAGFTYKDANADTVAVTENDQLIVQTYSTLFVTPYSATAKNGAIIKQYEATINGVTVASNADLINCGQISKSGNLTLTVKAIDSRGYAVSVSKTVAVIAYEKADITEVSIRRKNEVEALTEVELTAKIASIMVAGENKNTFRYLQYRYKKTSDSAYGSFYTVDESNITISGNTVKFETDEFVSLDPNYSYNIQFYICDNLTSDDDTAIIAQGIPLISKRRKRVGINNRNPQSALDVVGEICMNGLYVLGYVGEVENDFNNYKSGGLYHYSGVEASNAPGNAGFLEVISNGSNCAVQRFTECSATCEIVVRAFYNDAWTSWNKK